MDVQFNALREPILILPLIILFIASVIPITLKMLRGNRELKPFAAVIWGFFGLLGASGTTFAVISNMLRESQEPFITAFSGAIVIDGMGIWISYLIYFLGAITLLLSYDHIAVRGKQFSEYLFLTLNSIIGMVLVVMSNDLMITFIAIEFMSLALYVIIALSRERTLSKEASFKYFVLGSFASAIFLFGISFVYGSVGSTSIPVITSNAVDLFNSNKLFVIGILMIVVGFAFKISVFPFHAWTPDVYQGAATPVTTLMSTAVKAASFLAFLRIFTSANFFRLEDLDFLNVMQWLAILTMTVGNVAALKQTNLKRMLAYSSIAHSGYMMVGIISAGFGENFDSGATGLLFYIFAYSLMTVGTFALVALFEKKETTILNIDGLKGLSLKAPLVALSFAILLLSLAGIPPTLGFFSKFYLFSAAMDQGFIWLSLWGVINSVISVYYYLKPVVYMYMSEDQPNEIQTRLVFTKATLVASAVFIVVFGILSASLFRVVQKSVITGL